MKKRKKIIIKIVVSVCLLVFLISKIDFAEVVPVIKQMNLMYAPLIILLLVLNYVVSSIRWENLLIFEHGKDVTVFYLTKLYFIGAFFNNFMPTSIGGDVYKIFKLGKKINSQANAFSATFMERFTGVLALVLISYIGLIQTWDFWLSFFPQAVLANTLLLIFIKIGIFAGFWVGIAGGFVALNYGAKKIKGVKKIFDSLLLYRGKNAVLLNAFGTSFIVQLIAITTQYFIFKSLGVDLPILYSLFVFPIITLASFFIPSLNGIGVQDFLYVQLFAVVGVPAIVAISASLLYHFFRLVVSLAGGVFYVLQNDNEPLPAKS